MPIKSNMVLGKWASAINFDLMGTEEADCWVGTEPFLRGLHPHFTGNNAKEITVWECQSVLLSKLRNQIIKSDLNT